MNSDLKVFVVDDDPGMRKSLGLVMQAAGLNAETFGSAEEFLDQYAGDSPGCMVLDLRLSGMSGLALLEVLRTRQCPMPAIMISGHGDVRAAVRSMQLGAIDFVEKPLDHRVLLQKVQNAIAKDRAQRLRQAEIAAIRSRFARLTRREQELLHALIAGKSSKQIAAEMGISFRTVENHRSHLLAKTGAENTADLVRMGIVADLTRLDDLQCVEMSVRKRTASHQ